MKIDLNRYLDALEPDGPPPVRTLGRLRELTGLVLKAAAPGAAAGDLVEILRPPRQPLLARVVGFKDELAVLIPLGDPEGLSLECTVRPTGAPLTLPVGDALLGRVLDGLGRPIDDGPPLPPHLPRSSTRRPAPAPLQRPPITQPFQTGVRAIDALLTLGVGQRVGLFAPAGAGKSTLLAQIARGADADVIVIALVGERGREVRDFLQDTLGPQGLQRAVAVVATADHPPLLRLEAAYVATAVAEHFRDQGRRVLLLFDSLTRFARALREVGLAAGEPPARQGFPPSVFRALPALLERAGTSPQGSITALYTLLLTDEDLHHDPIAEEARAALDGHIVLSRRLAERGWWPAIAPLPSLSRLSPRLTSPEVQRAAAHLRRLLAAWEAQRDLIALGAYKPGADPDVDEALRRLPDIEDLLTQGPEPTPLKIAQRRLLDLLA